MSSPIEPTTSPTSGPVPTPVPSDPSPADISALAAQLKAMATPSVPAVSINQATVVDVDLTATPPTASITMSGSSTQVDGVRFISGYTPVIGDTIEVITQNASTVILGHVVDIGTATEATGGWNTPVLSSGFTTVGNSNGPVQYRVITDNGVFKMQWKGSVSHSGSNTPIISGANVLATQYRPAAKVSMISARTATDSLVVGLDFGTDGSVTLVGPTLAQSGGGTTSSSGGHSHTVFDDHTHSHGGAVATTSFADSGTDDPGGHTHTGGAPTVAQPTWISFNGIEYFL